MGSIRVLYTDKDGTESIIVADSIQYIEEDVRLTAENVDSIVELQMTKEEYTEVIMDAFTNGKVDLRKFRDVTDEEYYDDNEDDEEDEEDCEIEHIENDNFFNERKGNKILNLFRNR